MALFAWFTKRKFLPVHLTIFILHMFTWLCLLTRGFAGGCQLSGPGSLQLHRRGEREEVVECRDQRSEKFSPRLSLARPVLCPARAAAWEIEHYESNVESFSAEEPERRASATALLAVKEEEQLWAIDSGLGWPVPLLCNGLLPQLMSFWFPRARP